MIKTGQKIQKNRGMTYVELIVVMSIFSTLASVVLFSYSEFQSKIDLKNLANDIALRIVQAQRSANSGLRPARNIGEDWKPSYGVFMEDSDPNNKTIKYFADLDNLEEEKVFDGLSCSGANECLELIDITKGNSIYKIEAYSGSTSTGLDDLSIMFTRPSEAAVFHSSSADLSNVSYVLITVKSPKDSQATASVKVFPSGRIEVN